MILNVSSVDVWSVCRSYKTRDCTTYRSVSARIPRMPSKVVFSSSRSSWAPHQNLISCFPKGTQLHCLSSASSLLLNGKLGVELSHNLPRLTSQRRLSLTPRASKYIPFSVRYPPMTKKPQWWWRTLACLPYLIPIHLSWIYGETAYNLHHFLEAFELITHPFLRVIARLPKWFLITYLIVLYLGVVRRKEWPHFLRFNVLMGILLEMALEVIGTVRHWMPRSVYWGKIGMHFCAAVSLGFLFTVLGSIWCALNGMYADVPFFCDAADRERVEDVGAKSKLFCALFNYLFLYSFYM